MKKILWMATILAMACGSQQTGATTTTVSNPRTIRCDYPDRCDIAARLPCSSNEVQASNSEELVRRFQSRLEQTGTVGNSNQNSDSFSVGFGVSVPVGTAAGVPAGPPVGFNLNVGSSETADNRHQSSAQLARGEFNELISRAVHARGEQSTLCNPVIDAWGTCIRDTLAACVQEHGMR